ncbi:response regulator, partial [bacterium]|nr:response regulator [bacterium]
VVMDIEMPKLSGLNALDILRVSRLTEQLPIIMTSAHGDKDTILRAVQRGADDFIVKPYSFAELTSRLAVHLFQLDFPALQEILREIPLQPASGIPSAELDVRFPGSGIHTVHWQERELCVLLPHGVSPEQAAGFNAATAQEKVLVLARFRSVWKCVWPHTAAPAAARKVG